MSNIIKINGQNLKIKEYNGTRVVTLNDIDELHQRPDGTARVTFNRHKERFAEGIDYFVCESYEADMMGFTAPNGLTLLTESGYLMLVKPFSDDLAWKVQRELVNNYFRAKKIVQPKTELQVLRAAIDQIEVAQQEAREAKQIAQGIKDAILHPDEDWRNWVNEQLNKVAFQSGNYKKIRRLSYMMLENRAQCRLDVRLTNLRNRMKTAGATKTKINQANYLDVIEEEPRLKEIYTNIVEKIVIKYSA